jgi:hypothetical protein
MDDARRKVTIVGGGVAALEALLALRDIAEERLELELVTPSSEFVYRPLAVAEPFGVGEAYRYDLVKIAREHSAALHLAGVQAVAPDDKRLVTWDGRTLDYDLLLLAVGAQFTVSIPGSVSLNGPGYTGRFRSVLRDLEERRLRRLAFAVPFGTSWPLPLYELALMTAGRAREKGLGHVEIHLVTPEAEPLELFGPRAAAAVRALLDERGVILHTGSVPAEARAGVLLTAPHTPVFGRCEARPQPFFECSATHRAKPRTRVSSYPQTRAAAERHSPGGGACQRSMVSGPRGREQHSSTCPGAGSSSGSGS